MVEQNIDNIHNVYVYVYIYIYLFTLIVLLLYSLLSCFNKYYHFLFMVYIIYNIIRLS